MADNKIVKITFEIDGITESVSSIDDAKNALTQLEGQAKKSERAIEDTGKEIKQMGSNATDAGEAGEGAMKVLDEATGGLATKVKEVSGGLKAMGKSAVTAFKGAIKGASGMGKALIATGIGAIVVGIGLLVAYWSDIKEFVSGVSSESETLMKNTQDTADAARDQLESTEASESTLRLAGKSEDEIRQLKIAQTDEIIQASLLLLEQQKQQKTAQVAAAKRNQEIAAGILAFLMLPVTVLLSAVDALTSGLAYLGVLEEGTNLAADAAMGAASLLFDPEETATEADAVIAETEKKLQTLQNKKDGFILKGKESDKKATEDAITNAQELEDELERLRAENISGAEAKALALLEIERKKQEQELIDKGASTELLLELDKNYEVRKKEITDQFEAVKEAKRIKDEEIAQANRDIVDDMLVQAGLDKISDMQARALAELEIQRQIDIDKITLAGATAEEIAKIEKRYSDKADQLKKEGVDYANELKKQEVNNALTASVAILDSISTLVGEGSIVGKAASVASTTISTYSAAQAAYASVVGIPVVGPVLAPIAAGVAVATGAMNIKKILSTKTPGKSGGGGGGGTPPMPSVPVASSFNPEAALEGAQGNDGNQDNIITSQQNGSQSQTVIKAYVVSDDMTSQQEADSKINDLARL